MRYTIAALMILPFTAFAAEPAETITVTTSSSIVVKPDAARIHYVVRVTEPSIDAAKETVNKLVATMNDGIKNLKLADLSYSAGATSYSRTGAAARAARAAAAPAQGTYSASVPMTATIREKDPEKLLKSVDVFVKKIVESGAQIAGDLGDADSPFAASARLASLNSTDAPRIEWYLSDESTIRKDAYRSAVRKAKADAETLSKEIGWETLRIISVTDGPGATRDPSEVVTPVVRAPSGQVTVTARVTLKCSR